MPIGADDYPEDLVPPDHLQALFDAAAMLVDQWSDDLALLVGGEGCDQASPTPRSPRSRGTRSRRASP